MWFIDSTGKIRRALVDTSGHIQVDILSSPAIVISGSVGVTNFPSDYPDANVAKLLAGGLPSALTSDKLKVRASEIETLLAGGLPAALDGYSLKVKEQSPLTEIDVDIAKVLNSAISLTNYLPVGIAYPAGTLIDPRSIRTLTATDIVTAKQSTASDLKVEIVQPATKELFNVKPQAKGVTTIIKSGAKNNGVSTIYTVTAGTTFYLNGGTLVLATNTAVGPGANAGYLQADTGGDGVFRTIAWLEGVTTALITSVCLVVPIVLSAPLPFPALTVFRVNSTGLPFSASASITGWEE